MKLYGSINLYVKMTWLDFGFGPIIFGALVALYFVKLAKLWIVATITVELSHRILQNFMGALTHM